jgi:glycosyltransferase involved in cell wall biosynthesis
VGERLSFCLVTTFFPPESFGGDAVHVHRLAGLLAARGHRVRVVHAPGAFDALATGVAPASGHERIADVEVLRVVTRPAQAAATYLTGEPVSYRGALREALRGFDVVHFHNPSLIGGPGALRMGDGLRLYTTHEHWLLCPTHGLFRYGREVCTTRTCWRCTLSYRRPPQLWRSTPLLSHGVSGLDLLLSPSRFTARLHEDRFPDVRVEVLRPPGVAPETLADLPRARAHARPYLAYVGRLEAIKGVRSLVDAFGQVRGDIDLVVVGDGGERADLEARARHDPRVVFLGPRAHREALAYARDARALVVPSVGLETFGGSGAEAMAVGTPVIVRDLGPLPELVEAGGGLVASGTAGLTRAMQELVDDEPRARTLGDDARRIATTSYAEGAFVDRYLHLIAEVARRRGRERTAELAEAGRRAEP